MLGAEGRPRSGIRHAPRSLDGRLGVLAAGHTAKLRGRASASWTWTVQRWTDPAPLPPRARDAWVYTRSLVVAHAKTYGIALDVDRATYDPPAPILPLRGTLFTPPEATLSHSDGSRAPTQHERGAQFR